MKIIDINGKERNAKSLKIIKHNVQDSRSGEIRTLEYVEAVLKGRNGNQWIEWYPLDEFTELNPGKEVKETDEYR